LDPEEREDRAPEHHDRYIDAHPQHDLPGGMPEIDEPPHPVLWLVDRRNVPHEAVDRLLFLELTEDRDPGVREEHPDHLDVCLQDTDQDHWQDTRVDELHREACPGAPDSGMRER